MVPWKLHDGTEVRLGGEVVGTSEVAEYVRHWFDRVKTGHSVNSMFGPRPMYVRLDLSVPYLVDAWLRTNSAALRVVSGPPVQYPEIPVGEPGVVY